MAGTTSTVPITIGGTLIEFPNTGASPNWAPAIIQFAQAVGVQLATVVSPFDVAATVQTLTSNTNVGITLNGNGSDLTFPSGSVRSFTFTYAIYRVSTGAGAMSITDTGTVTGVYNTTTVGWSINHTFSGDVQPSGLPWNTFSVDSSDRLTLTTVALPTGTYDFTHSTISYSATTELVHL